MLHDTEDSKAAGKRWGTPEIWDSLGHKMADKAQYKQNRVHMDTRKGIKKRKQASLHV